MRGTRYVANEGEADECEATLGSEGWHIANEGVVLINILRRACMNELPEGIRKIEAVAALDAFFPLWMFACEEILDEDFETEDDSMMEAYDALVEAGRATKN